MELVVTGERTLRVPSLKLDFEEVSLFPGMPLHAIEDNEPLRKFN